MEDFLKFIPIALYVLYKIFGERKKTEQSPLNTPSKPKRKSPSQNTTSLEDILRELSGEMKPEPKQVIQKTEAKSNKIEIVDHQFDTLPAYEHHARVAKNTTKERQQVNRIKSLDDEEYEEILDAEAFDLRQAIIAQTILVRPQY
jgi:hypothetical protein